MSGNKRPAPSLPSRGRKRLQLPKWMIPSQPQTPTPSISGIVDATLQEGSCTSASDSPPTSQTSNCAANPPTSQTTTRGVALTASAPVGSAVVPPVPTLPHHVAPLTSFTALELSSAAPLSSPEAPPLFRVPPPTASAGQGHASSSPSSSSATTTPLSSPEAPPLFHVPPPNASAPQRHASSSPSSSSAAAESPTNNDDEEPLIVWVEGKTSAAGASSSSAPFILQIPQMTDQIQQMERDIQTLMADRQSTQLRADGIDSRLETVLGVVTEMRAEMERLRTEILSATEPHRRAPSQ